MQRRKMQTSTEIRTKVTQVVTKAYRPICQIISVVRVCGRAVLIHATRLPLTAPAEQCHPRLDLGKPLNRA